MLSIYIDMDTTVDTIETAMDRLFLSKEKLVYVKFPPSLSNEQFEQLVSTIEYASNEKDI